MTNDQGATEAAFPQPSGPGLVAGIGLRAATRTTDLLALLDACLVRAGAVRADVVALATLDARGDHPALRAAARALGLPVLALPPALLGGSVPNPSARVAEAVGVSSVAEAAALVFGPLLVEKQRRPGVTCALSRYAPASRSSESMAASRLATSSAGP